MAREDIHIFSEDEIIQRLENLSGWNYNDNKISKEFQFKDFMEALLFITKMSNFFEKNDHHPDIHIYYSKVLFELTRWDIGGKVTNIDFITAEEIERVFKEFLEMNR